MTRREFEITQINEIIQILDDSKVLHLGLVDEGMPYIVPMNYGYTLEEEKLTIYLHGAPEGYKNDVIAKYPTCCFEMECGVKPFEGQVACQYGTEYRSLMGRGKVFKIEDGEEKIRAMKAIMKTQTGKDFDFTERLLSIVAMFRIDVEVFTAKHRPAPAPVKAKILRDDK